MVWYIQTSKYNTSVALLLFWKKEMLNARLLKVI